jgi:hypothetical protein
LTSKFAKIYNFKFKNYLSKMNMAIKNAEFDADFFFIYSQGLGYFTKSDRNTEMERRENEIE